MMEGKIFELSSYGGDYDQHYYAANQIFTKPRYDCDLEKGEIQIDDPVWDKCVIGHRPGDEIFLELYTNPVVQRTAAIEQLTLPRYFSTMPGSTEMPRWEHIWGSVVFARKMVEKAEKQGRVFDDREVLTWQLRTFVSDLGHTAFSHLGDWLFQGYGGAEDQHDEELKEILDFGGINEILLRHGFAPDEIIFPEVTDWIENKSPELCVDRIDYGAREILRWVTGYEPSKVWQWRFELDADNRIIMPNLEEAKSFALRYALLSTEHWGHPVHRLQLQLFGELVRSIVADEDLRGIWWDSIHHPRDLLYTVDYDVNASSRAVGALNHDLFGLMLDIGRAQRKIFAHGRLSELSLGLSGMTEFVSDRNEFSTYPEPLIARHWSNKYTGVKPGNIEFIPVQSKSEVTDFDQLPHTLDIFLPPLKPRSVDPFFKAGSSIMRVSQADEHFRKMMEQQAVIQSQAYVGRVYGAPDFVQGIKKKLQEVEEIWQSQLQLERAGKEKMQKQFEHIGAMAIGHSMVEIHWWG